MGEDLLDLPAAGTRGIVHLAENLRVLERLPAASIDLIYIDPPFNTGKTQSRTRLRTRRAPEGERVGFGGHRYDSEVLGTLAYEDCYDDYAAFLQPRLEQAHRVLKDSGSLYVHLDYREVHYVKVQLDAIFGRECFLNEIIWAYDYGGRPSDRWPAKHDTLLFYVKKKGAHVWNREAIERIPYMAPGLVGPEKAARGKLPTDTWWHTIVSPTGKEKLGYPTQKPLGILRRVVAASSPPEGLVLDFFAGSGTTGAAALALGRRFVLVDHHAPAFDTMQRRFAQEAGIVFRREDERACAAQLTLGSV